MSDARIYDGSALPPPEGVVPYVTNHSEEQSWYHFGAALCTAVSGIFLLLRLYTKLRIARQADFTDAIIVLAFLFLITLTIVGRQVLAEGAAVHMWNLQTKHFIKMQYRLYVSEILYGPTIFLVKFAILLQYLRLLAPAKSINPPLFVGARAIIAITFVYYVISTAITIFACSPRERIWNPLITGGHCLNNNISVLFTCLFNIVSDVIILLLPARTVWKLHIPRRKKIGIILLFATGLLACIANAMIIYYILLMSGAKADISYNTAWMGLWVLAEISLGIIVSCTFSLPRFVEAEGPRFRTVYRSVTKPLTSIPGFGSLLAYSKIDSSLSNTATQDVVALDQVHPETRQYFQAIDDAVELNHPHGSKKEWNEIS